MVIVLYIFKDLFQYIFGLDDVNGKPQSIALIDSIATLVDTAENFAVIVPDIIRDGVQRNMPYHLLNKFYRFIVRNPKVVYGFLYDVSKSLARKYRELGLKKGDATIAAFAEWQKVDCFISENRHIYQELKVEAFFTCNAEEFINNLNSGKIWQMLHNFRASKSVSEKDL